MISRGVRHLSSCAVEETPIVDEPPVDVIGTPGDGNWYDSNGNRNYFAVEVKGKRKVLKRANLSSALIHSGQICQ